MFNLNCNATNRATKRSIISLLLRPNYFLSGSNRYRQERNRTYSRLPTGTFARWLAVKNYFGQVSINGTFAWPRSVPEQPAPNPPEWVPEEPAAN